MATLLVQSGVLKQGDMIIAGEEFGRVRNMFDESHNSIKEAGPSSPAVVLGLSKTPSAGGTASSTKLASKSSATPAPSWTPK